MIRMIRGCEPVALNAMTNSVLRLEWTTLGHKLWPLDAMNSSGLLMALPTLGHEPALDVM